MLEINVNVRFPDLPELLEKLRGLAPAVLTLLDPSSLNQPENAPVADLTPAAVITPPKTTEAKPAQTVAPTAPVSVVPAPTIPVEAPPTEAPSFTLAQVARAGADLLTAKPALQPQLAALLEKYGAETVVELKPGDLGAFAADLRGMGAKI